MAGDFRGTLDFGVGPLMSAGDTDLFVAKLDPDGNGLFARRYGDASAQHLVTFARAGDSDVRIGGAFQGSLDLGGAPLVSAGQTDAFAARLTTP